MVPIHFVKTENTSTLLHLAHKMNKKIASAEAQAHLTSNS